MARLECSTVVHVPPERVFEQLVDFEGYPAYSTHLDAVERDGDGGPGTVYAVTASWWRLSRTVRSEVTTVDPPSRLDWRLLGPIEASGAWTIEAIDVTAPDPSSRLELVVDYEPSTLAAVDLPLAISRTWLTERLVPVVEREARDVCEQLVAELEGERREVDLEVRLADQPG